MGFLGVLSNDIAELRWVGIDSYVKIRMCSAMKGVSCESTGRSAEAAMPRRPDDSLLSIVGAAAKKDGSFETTAHTRGWKR